MEKGGCGPRQGPRQVTGEWSNLDRCCIRRAEVRGASGGMASRSIASSTLFAWLALASERCGSAVGWAQGSASTSRVWPASLVRSAV